MPFLHNRQISAEVGVPDLAEAAATRRCVQRASHQRPCLQAELLTEGAPKGRRELHEFICISCAQSTEQNSSLRKLLDMGYRLHHAGTAVRCDRTVRRHHHLIGNHRHKVIDWEDSRLNRLRRPNVGAEGFEIEKFSVHFLGLCSVCRRKINK